MGVDGMFIHALIAFVKMDLKWDFFYFSSLVFFWGVGGM